MNSVKHFLFINNQQFSSETEEIITMNENNQNVYKLMLLKPLSK